ncbi:MAG: hypothetical protein IJZ82_03930 [Lachnospiraceae bacterium]|nr:hypothetical protein [Lachnospiraceae bacterium]
MKKIKTYGHFVLGILILLWVALLLPQIIFQVQDGYRFLGKSGESWEYSDNQLVSAGYEKDMYKRMSALMEKKTEELTVSAINYGGKNVDEVVDLLERVFASEWMGNINEMTWGIYYDFLQETSTVNIRDCKKYVVYENTSLKNILLMMWYLDIYMVGYDTSVRLLIDAETEAVYYIAITGEGEYVKESESHDKKVTAAYTEFDAYSRYEMCETASYFMHYFNSYYAAGMEDLEGFNEEGWENDDVWYVTRVDDEESYNKLFVMPYGNLSTYFEVMVSNGRNVLPDYRAGVQLVCLLVPEMIQD